MSSPEQMTMFYCAAKDCNSKNKLIRTIGDITKEHGNHVPKIETFENLRQTLLEEDFLIFGQDDLK